MTFDQIKTMLINRAVIAVASAVGTFLVATYPQALETACQVL